MRIIIVGDSLTLPRPKRINEFDYRITEPLAVEFDDTYGALLQRSLLETHSDIYPLVINRGQRAFTIKDVFNQSNDHLFFMDPDVVILHVGIVDCWIRDSEGKQIVALDEFKVFANEFIDRLLTKPTCKLIIIGIAPTSVKMEERTPAINQQIGLYNRVFWQRVDYERIFYIDLESRINPYNTREYLLPDDQHINVDGNRLLFEQIAPLILSFIDQ